MTSGERDLIEKRANDFRVPGIGHAVVIDAEARLVHDFRRDTAEIDMLRQGDVLSLDGTMALDLPVADFFEWLD